MRRLQQRLEAGPAASGYVEDQRWTLPRVVKLAGPIVLVWDNLQGHVSAKMKALIAARPWLRVHTLPAYVPELNPVEKVWSHLKRSLADLAAGNATNLSRLAKTKLRKMQYVDGLIDGFFRATGLSSP
jgi:hypothetical protein